MAANLKLRHKVIKTIRNFLDAQDFLEVETPILGRATPEGARDFLVPSRSETLHNALCNIGSTLQHTIPWQIWVKVIVSATVWLKAHTCAWLA